MTAAHLAVIGLLLIVVVCLFLCVLLADKAKKDRP